MDKAWEKRCRRCGRCCFEKDFYEGEVHYTDEACEFLDLQTRECLVYARRHELRPGCAQLTPEVLGMGVLPADCPYVSDIENYPAPRMPEEDDRC